jgi:hypothetical protein
LLTSDDAESNKRSKQFGEQIRDRNVFTVCPGTPVLAAPNPKLSSGSAPEVKISVKNGVEKTTATKLSPAGSAADVNPGSTAVLAAAAVLPTVSETSPLVI